MQLLHDTAPSSEYVSAAHNKHEVALVAPAADENLPAVQSEQLLEPADE